MDVDGQGIAGLCAFDEDRAGDGVDLCCDLVEGFAFVQLVVDLVVSFKADGLTGSRLDPENGFDVGAEGAFAVVVGEEVVNRCHDPIFCDFTAVRPVDSPYGPSMPIGHDQSAQPFQARAHLFKISLPGCQLQHEAVTGS